jgi:hypothetical protein
MQKNNKNFTLDASKYIEDINFEIFDIFQILNL